MKPAPKWQSIAQRLAESGWSWQHVKLSNRATPDLHVAEAHNEDGQTHAAVAGSIGPAFAALDESIQTASK
jgi:hypothetical protein